MDQLSRAARKRLEFIRHFEKINDVTKTCKAYKISRPTFYKWYKRYQELGNDGLEDQPKIPKSKVASTNQSTTEAPASTPPQIPDQAEPESDAKAPNEPKMANTEPITPSTTQETQNATDQNTEGQEQKDIPTLVDNRQEEAPKEQESTTDFNISRPATSDTKTWQEPQQAETTEKTENIEAPKQPEAPKNEKQSIWDEPEKKADEEKPAPQKTEEEPTHQKKQGEPQAKSETKPQQPPDKEEESYVDLIVKDVKTLVRTVPKYIKINKKTTGWIGIIVALILAATPPIYFYGKYREALNKTENPEAAAQKEAEQLVKKVGELIELPADELPTVATVFNKDELKNQPFFKEAKEGDKVLIYQDSGKAILYDPEKHIIVEVGILNAAAQPTPTP